MASEQAKELRRQGIAAAKAGQKDEARQMLQQALRLEPTNEAAWLWLMSVARDQREKLVCLYRLLQVNPDNEVGVKSLQSLGLTLAELAQQLGLKPPPTAAPAPAQPPAPQTPGIPIADPQRIAQAQSELDVIVRDYLAPFDAGIEWTRKTGQRAGERDVLVLRLYLAIGVAVLLIALIGGGAVVVLNNPAARAVLFAPTTTPSRTPMPPTQTYTPTPGQTPTPSPTPELTYTPSPTVPPKIPRNALEPTEIYPPVIERSIRDAVALLNQGQVELVLPTLEFEVTLVASDFNPNPYFYRALALAEDGQLDAAAALLQNAERRLPEKPNDNYAPLVNAGLAYVDTLRAARALDEGRRDEARALMTNVEDRAEAAITGDARLMWPYLALARRYALVSDYNRAIGVLDRGLSVPELAANIYLIVEKGEMYFKQGEYDLAAYQAFLALYIYPAAEPAHLLQIQVALAQDQPGLAVLLAQGYLFYYPGSVGGYRLLGDARVREGNFDLALEAYNQALAGGDDHPLTPEVLAARAALYERQGRYDLARDDLTRAFTLTDDPALRALRMQAAYRAGNNRVAEDDAEALLGTGVIPDAEIQLLQARILIDEARDAADFETGLSLLDAASTDLPDEQRPLAAEYQARALYNLGSYDDALRAITGALAAAETGSRHYLRGLILEAQGETEAAARDYDWVLTWSQVYPYSFAPDALQRLEAIRQS
ncbi:MAG: tetratricopeptide repeat protein [Chloroflexi bacterium]|nr:tetratricopeptide repeat protein [Chloroflexota bacterium]